jgi:hypothetical protein
MNMVLFLKYILLEFRGGKPPLIQILGARFARTNVADYVR